MLGDINCSGVFRVGGVTLTAWCVSGTNIYYTAGNVGINTTSPQSKLHIVNSSTALNPDVGITGIYVFNPTNSANHHSVITNRIGGSSAGRVMYNMLSFLWRLCSDSAERGGRQETVI